MDTFHAGICTNILNKTKTDYFNKKDLKNITIQHSGTMWNLFLLVNPEDATI